MSWNERKLCKKVSLVNMKIGAANSCELNLDEYFALFRFRGRNLSDSKIFCGIVDDSFHGQKYCTASSDLLLNFLYDL